MAKEGIFTLHPILESLDHVAPAVWYVVPTDAAARLGHTLVALDSGRCVLFGGANPEEAFDDLLVGEGNCAAIRRVCHVLEVGLKHSMTTW